ncbi:MAG TPA: hypothetical protein VIB01_01240 [Steroidobacteraceae bacterium]
MQHAHDAFWSPRRPAAPAGDEPARSLRGNAILVLGDHRQALAVARSLHRAGHRVIAGRGAHRTLLERSRCVAEVWEHPSVRDRVAFARALEAFCAARRDLGAVFPVGVEEIDLISPLAARLPVLVVAAGAAALAACRSKRALLALADSLDVPNGKWAVVRDRADLLPALARVGLPAVVKPDGQGGARGFKAAILEGHADAVRFAGRIPFPACRLVVQRLAPGTRHNVYFLARKGGLLGIAQMQILRTDRPDGTGLAVEGMSVAPDLALVRWTAALAHALDYTGAGCAQFMVDSSTTAVSFLEINARLGANCAAPCACGFDLPRLFVEVLLGTAIPQGPARTGRRYAWLEGDLHGLASSLVSGHIGWRAAAAWLLRTLLAQLRAHDHIVFSWRDPLPTLATLHRWIQAAWRRARGAR